MDKKMSLEQVGTALRSLDLNLMADAIDAELKARGKVVAFRYLMPIGNAFTWTRWLEIGDIHLHSTDGRKIEYAYTAPPAPKIEVTDAMVERLAKRLNHYAWNEDKMWTEFCDTARDYLEVALKETP